MVVHSTIFLCIKALASLPFGTTLSSYVEVLWVVPCPSNSFPPTLFEGPLIDLLVPSMLSEPIQVVPLVLQWRCILASEGFLF
jgi:hypothetical protein